METLTWERVAVATGPGEGVEEAVRAAYREVGLAEPETVLVLPSPAAGAVVAAWLTGDETVRAALRESGLGRSETVRRALEESGQALGEVVRRALQGSGLPGRSAPEGHADGGPEEPPGDGSEGLAGGGPAKLAGGDSVGRAGGGGPAEVVGRLLGRSVRDELRTRPWERARAEMYAELGPAGWARSWAETGGRLWPRVERLVGDIRRAIAGLAGDSGGPAGGSRDPVGGSRDLAGGSGSPVGGSRDAAGGLLGERLRQVTLDAVLGQHDAPWLSAFDGLDGLKRVAEQAGWWWPYKRLAIVTERPVELHLDDSGRLHRADGPAMLYADGFALHAWHGMPVPADFGAQMSGLTPARIRAEQNAELRRVMLEHFGLERYLAESGAKPVQSDETGVLWQVYLTDDESPFNEPMVLVEVVNSTPEPDGTSRKYFLQVPPWVERARQGVAWTFGVSEEEYFPQRET